MKEITAPNYPIQGQEHSVPPKKSKRLFFGVIIAAITILILAIVIFAITFLSSKEPVRQKKSPSEFPSSPIGDIPPFLNFIKLGSYYFADSVSLKNYKILSSPAVFSIFCGKGEQQKLIYVKAAKKGEDLSKNKDYQCWVKNCQNNQGNLYIALKWLISGSFMGSSSGQIQDIIAQENNPICQNTN